MWCSSAYELVLTVVHIPNISQSLGVVGLCPRHWRCDEGVSLNERGTLFVCRVSICHWLLFRSLGYCATFGNVWQNAGLSLLQCDFLCFLYCVCRGAKPWVSYCFPISRRSRWKLSPCHWRRHNRRCHTPGKTRPGHGSLGVRAHFRADHWAHR